MKQILTLLIIFILFISSASLSAAYAQFFKFQLANPGSTPQAGSTFDVKVLINTTGKQSLGADAIVVFESSKVSTKSATSGNFYNVFQDHAIGGTTNKYLLSAWQATALTPVSTSTDTLFATVTFNALASGSTQLSFECTSGISDSNIWDTNQADMINCGSSTSLTVNIGGPGPTSTPSATMTPAPTATPAATATPRPTSTPVPTNTPKPTISELPRTGVVEVTLGALGLGALLTIVGLLVIL